MVAITLKPGAIALADLRRIVRGGDTVALTDGWRGPVEASLAAVRARLAGGESLYGINTGFGKLAKTRISDGELATLQLYLMRSHAAGVGDPLADSTVRLVLVLKAASLARGFSGARAGERRHPPRRAVAGLGGRFGRPCAARAPVARADRRGPRAR
jgi:histidine ammonia-lyase